MSDFEQQQPPPVTDASADAISAEQRQWAMFAHLSALVGGVITGGWAFSVGCFIGPLIIWMIKKDTMPFVDDQAKEALNFNITVAIIFFVLWAVTFLTLFIGGVLTVPLMVIVGIAWLVLTVIASIKANQGERYRYPFTLRLVK